MRRASAQIQGRLALAFVLLLAFVVMGTTGYRAILGGSWLDCLYMTVITLSTVGYGEVVPGLAASPWGRGFTIGLILLGVGTSAYVISTMTALFVEGELTNLLRSRKMQKRINAMSDHALVCGAGMTGIHVINELAAIRQPFVVIEQNEAHLHRALQRFDFPFVIGDATTDEVLIQAGVERAGSVVTVLAADKDNLFVTISARQLNPRARIVARGIDTGLRDRILRAGANAVVFPNQIGGMRLVSELVRPHVVGFLDRMLRAGEHAWRIEEVEITATSPAVGQPLASLDLPGRLGLPVLALTRDEGRDVRYYPASDTVLTAGDRLVVLAERSHVERLRDIVRGPA